MSKCNRRGSWKSFNNVCGYSCNSKCFWGTCLWYPCRNVWSPTPSILDHIALEIAFGNSLGDVGKLTYSRNKKITKSFKSNKNKIQTLPFLQWVPGRQDLLSPAVCQRTPPCLSSSWRQAGRKRTVLICPSRLSR